MLAVGVKAMLWHFPAAAAQRNNADCVFTQQGCAPALPSLCPGEAAKDC